MNNEMDKSWNKDVTANKVVSALEQGAQEVKDKAYSVGEKVAEAGQTVKETWRDVKSEVKEKAQDVSRDMKKEYREAKDSLSDDGAKVFDEAKKLCVHGYEKTKDQFCKHQDNLETFIKEKPICSTAIAIGVGFLAALLVGKKTRHHHRHSHPPVL